MDCIKDLQSVVRIVISKNCIKIINTILKSVFLEKTGYEIIFIKLKAFGTLKTAPLI